MAIEIERKFLVHHDILPPLEDGQKIVQGYLSEEPQVRFRLLDDRIVIAVKKKHPDGTRFELETEKMGVSEEECLALRKLAILPVIEKVRYRILYEGLIWEVDVYQGVNEGLITVDVELPSLDYPIVFPPWVKVGADITDDPAYFNTNLGRRPFSLWEKSARKQQ